MATITVTDAFELILESLENYQLCAGTLSPKFECPEDSPMARELHSMSDFIDQFTRLYRQWIHLCACEKGGHLVKMPILASLGARSPEFNYEDAILESMVQFEARTDFDEVIDEVGRSTELAPADLERAPTYPFNPRWSVAVFNAVVRMVQRGWLREEEDGVLVLTEQGRQAYQKQAKPSQG